MGGVVHRSGMILRARVSSKILGNISAVSTWGWNRYRRALAIPENTASPLLVGHDGREADRQSRWHGQIEVVGEL
jgi:hypothetical protein